MNQMHTGNSLSEIVKQALAEQRTLRISGSGSKSFYGNSCSSSATTVDVTRYQGIIDYEPSELFIRAYAGTSIVEIEQELQKHQQYLPFDPPRYGGKGTLGGMIATGLSGPGRPYQGAVRDYILGVKCINGKGEILQFGGQVIKNVAGYDVSRLMCGAMGTLGILLEVTIKVLPRPETQLTIEYPCNCEEALALMQKWQHNNQVISGMSYESGVLRVRLSGTHTAVRSAQKSFAFTESDDGYWQLLRDHQLEFFQNNSAPLWRIHPRRGCSLKNISMEQSIIDWGGGQYWLSSDSSYASIQSLTSAQGAYATLFHNHSAQHPVFPVLDKNTQRLQHNIKSSFDPQGIMNPGILSPEY